MTTAKADVLQGTLDLLILKILALEPQHGWGIAQRLQQISNEVLAINQGSLYPALHRLAARGWVRAEWGASENNRRAKYYALTAAGRRQLAEETASWERLAEAVARVLRTA
jgi:PadR family transcriptional regulator